MFVGDMTTICHLELQPWKSTSLLYLETAQPTKLQARGLTKSDVNGGFPQFQCGGLRANRMLSFSFSSIAIPRRACPTGECDDARIDLIHALCHVLAPSVLDQISHPIARFTFFIPPQTRTAARHVSCCNSRYIQILRCWSEGK